LPELPLPRETRMAAEVDERLVEMGLIEIAAVPKSKALGCVICPWAV